MLSFFQKVLNIVGALTAILIFLPILNAYSAQVTLAWNPSVTSGVSGYIIHYGTSSGEYPSSVDVGNTTSCTISNLDAGETYYFVATAYFPDGVESVFSNEAAHSMPQADADGDGILDVDEIAVYGTDPEKIDTDGDGMNDGDELAYWAGNWDSDHDSDGVINLLDSDSDNDCFSDGVEVVNDFDPADPNSMPQYVQIWLEAEQADLNLPLETSLDETASSGEYIWAPNGSGTVFDSGQDSGYAEFTFQIPDAGYYVIWGRVLAVNGSDDSFFVSANNDAYALWDTQQANDWVWDRVANRDDLDPVIYHFEAGQNTILIKQREDGTKLDKLLITNDMQYVPEGLGATELLPPTFEVGETLVNHDWKHISLTKTFVDPIVVARSLSHNGGDPAVIITRSVDNSGFEIKLQEWDYLDGTHSKETAGYLVMERGSYTLDNGIRLEASRFETDLTSSFGPVNFNQPFQNMPVVIAALSSANEPDTVTGRIRNIDTNGFEYRLQEQELNAKDHAMEMVSYIAWEPSSGQIGGYRFEVNRTENIVGHKFHTILFGQTFTNIPAFLADMQTTDGGDTANVRWQNRDNYAVDVQIDEEQSRDSETNHTSEVVGYMLFSPKN